MKKTTADAVVGCGRDGSAYTLLWECTEGWGGGFLEELNKVHIYTRTWILLLDIPRTDKNTCLHSPHEDLGKGQ